MMTVLLECPRLELLLFHGRRPRDPFMAVYENYIADWDTSAKGLPDMWSRADDLVARTRRGEIEATFYWLN
ncbi:hypothetical protein B0H19DRAFT_1364998 [Mycena capillaripes]|nr:hypothetical protein B0H19DRAFT_1364998 [Mycena capillaripes]